jgi:hypothetical protein
MSDKTSDKPGWRGAFREPNAIGWIAFLILMIGIGVGTIYFGGDMPASKLPKPIAASHAAK